MNRRFAMCFVLGAGVALLGCGPGRTERGSPPAQPPARGDAPPDTTRVADAATRPTPADVDARAAADQAEVDTGGAMTDASPSAADAAAGVVLWQNEGTASPWGHLLKDPGCTLTEVSSPTYRGGKALKHVVSFPDTRKLSVHCEVARDPVAIQGDDLYYGWAFMLGDDWPDTYDRKSVISQMTARGMCWNQLDFFTLAGVQRFTDEAGGGPDSCTPGSDRLPAIADVVTRNVWHRMVVHKVWKGDESGLIEIWFDGDKKVTAHDIATGWGDLKGGYAWHVGVYAGVDQVRQGSRTIYTDQFRVARTYEAADPASWGGP
jgi:hypothetical protein